MPDRFVLRLEKGREVVWVVYLPGKEGPWRLQNTTGEWRGDCNEEMWWGYREGFGEWNEVMREYVGGRLREVRRRCIGG